MTASCTPGISPGAYIPKTPVLKVDRALHAVEKAGVSRCSLGGAVQEAEPLLNGFDCGFGPDS